jgi:hypothetical protein
MDGETTLGVTTFWNTKALVLAKRQMWMWNAGDVTRDP